MREDDDPRPGGAGTISLAFVLSLVLVPIVIVTGLATDRSKGLITVHPQSLADPALGQSYDNLGLRRSLPDDVDHRRPS